MSKNIKRMFVEAAQTTVEDAYERQLTEEELDVELGAAEMDALDVEEVDVEDELPEEISTPKMPKIVDPTWVNKRVYDIYKFITNLQKDFVGSIDIKETKENEKLVTEINKDLLSAQESLIKLVRSSKRLRELDDGVDVEDAEVEEPAA